MNQQGLLISYRYDALDRLIGVEPAGASATTRVYRDDRLATQLQGGQQHSLIEAGGHVLAQCTRSGRSVVNSLLGCDQQNSVLQTINGNTSQRTAYTPYGGQVPQGGVQSLLGFNGEQPDPVTGCYLLGNGYRAYNPVLMRFHSPDSMSPFDSGGLNPYAYCMGDPVNMSDPTGHFSFKAFLGIAVSVAAIALTVITLGAGAPLTGPAVFMAAMSISADVIGIAGEIASETSPDSDTGQILGYLSMGLAAATLAGGKVAKIAASRGNKVAARFIGKGAATATRQGAIKAPQGKMQQGLKRAVAVGKATKASIAAPKVFRRAKEIAKYVDWIGYRLDAEDLLQDIIGDDTKPSGTGESDQRVSTLDTFVRGNAEQAPQGMKQATIKPGEFLTADQSRMLDIRAL
jgi:RHS repeat-associated protein